MRGKNKEQRTKNKTKNKTKNEVKAERCKNLLEVSTILTDGDEMRSAAKESVRTGVCNHGHLLTLLNSGTGVSDIA